VPETPATAVQPPPEGIPVNPDKVLANVLGQLTNANLIAAKWQALAEELMQTCTEQQGMIDELKKRPVHSGRVTKTAGATASAKSNGKGGKRAS
jgi:hypothetical protein